MSDPAAAVTQAATRLAVAERDRVPCAPVRDLVPATIEAGYAVQRVLTEASLARGRRVVGRKVGLTNPAVQAQLGVDQPDFGVLYADMAVRDGGPIDARELLQPRIEAEIAVVLAADVRGDEDEDSLRKAVKDVVAALEIVDSRVTGWDISIVDTIADNGSSARYVLGSSPVPLGDLDLRQVHMVLSQDGHPISTGHGVDCLGDPLAALAWLARSAAEHGASNLSEDVVFRFGNADAAHGRAEVSQAVDGFFSSIAGLTHHVREVWDVASDVSVVHADVEYRRQDGETVMLPNVDILRWRGDLVEDWQIVIDVGPIYAPIGEVPGAVRPAANTPA